MTDSYTSSTIELHIQRLVRQKILVAQYKQSGGYVRSFLESNDGRQRMVIEHTDTVYIVTIDDVFRYARLAQSHAARTLLAREVTQLIDSYFAKRYVIHHICLDSRLVSRAMQLEDANGAPLALLGGRMKLTDRLRTLVSRSRPTIEIIQP